VGPQIAPAGYAAALVRLHAALRQTGLAAPHFTDRVAGAQREVGDRERTPALPGPDRELLSTTLSTLSSSINRGGLASSCCTASRIRAMCSARGKGRCSWTSGRAAAGRSSLTLPMPRRGWKALSGRGPRPDRPVPHPHVGAVHHMALAPRRPAARQGLLESGGTQPGPGSTRSPRIGLGLTGPAYRLTAHS
jgi:hypothetical protein